MSKVTDADSKHHDKTAKEVVQKPSLGRIVLFRKFDSNGVNEHPAIITRVWSDTCVNLTIFPDFGELIFRTSINFNDDVNSEQDFSWRWPPRV